MRRFALAIFLLLALLPGCKSEVSAQVGKPAPALTALTLGGDAIKLEDLRGKVVLVNFWWSGCGPCLTEMPQIDVVYRALADQGFEVLAVNMGQDAKEVRAVMRRTGVSYPLLLDGLKIDAKKYGVVAAPTSFLIDRDGNVVERINGPMTGEQLQARVEALG
ncbi:MAG: thioredoxin [Rhodobacterales bacterium]|nr:MAG: thioredoxin [Rhodobacterales bacterium]